MAVQCARIYAWDSIGSDGFPVVSAPVPLFTLTNGQKEVNLVQVGYTPDVSSDALEGDDNREENDVSVSYGLQLQSYGISPEAAVAMGFYVRDSNNNLIPVAKPSKHFALFVRHADQKGPVRETWYYDLKATPRSETFKTQSPGTVTDPVSIDLKGALIYPTGYSEGIAFAEVLKGNTGFVGGEPGVNDFYKPATGSGQ